jgi:dynein heavy chain
MQIELESKYHQVFVFYTRRDLEGVRKLYQKYKDTPPIPRNQPPVSGAISWARQLYRRLENPMVLFKANTTILDTADAKKHIRNYNKLLRALVDFEILYYRAWCTVIDQAKSGLQATLLVTNPEGQMCVNFDPQIVQLIKEAKGMIRLGLDLPESARVILAKEGEYKKAYSSLANILSKKTRLIENVSPVLRKALAPQVEALEATLQPGLTSLTW